MRRFVFGALCTLGLTSMAFAELQSVKVGGELTTAYQLLNNLDYTDVDTRRDGGHFFTTARLDFNYDFTDSVSSKVSLINERDWNLDGDGEEALSVNLEEGWVLFKNLLQTNFCFQAGRQHLMLGKGIVFADARINDSATLVNYSVEADGVLGGQSYTNPWQATTSAFDALKLCYKVADGVSFSSFYAIQESSNVLDASETSHNFLSASINFGGPDCSMLPVCGQLYYLWDYASDEPVDTAVNSTDTSMNYIGGLVGVPLFGGLKICSELAYLFGSSDETSARAATPVESSTDISGLAWNIALKYMPMETFNFSFMYDYRSGDADTTDADNKSWTAPHYAYAVGNLIDQLYTSGDSELNVNGLSAFFSGFNVVSFELFVS